jgi:hypothetical protein
MKAASQPFSPTSQATSSKMPIKTGTVTATVGIQKRPVLSAKRTETKAETILIAVVIVGNG